MATKKNTTPVAGQNIVYVSTQGKQKSALVSLTPDMVQEGTSVPPLEEGELHILVLSPTGNIKPRFNVPSQELAQKSLDAKKAEAEADEDFFEVVSEEDEGTSAPTGYWKFV